jgi:hypothetical protein
MADVDQSVLVDAYVRYGRIHGRQKLVEIFDKAFCDINDGVKITSVSFEGASGSGQQIKIDPADLLVIVEQALQEIDGIATSGRSNHILFGASILET